MAHERKKILFFVVCRSKVDPVVVSREKSSLNCSSEAFKAEKRFFFEIKGWAFAVILILAKIHPVFSVPKGGHTLTGKIQSYRLYGKFKEEQIIQR